MEDLPFQMPDVLDSEWIPSHIDNSNIVGGQSLLTNWFSSLVDKLPELEPHVDIQHAGESPYLEPEEPPQYVILGESHTGAGLEPLEFEEIPPAQQSVAEFRASMANMLSTVLVLPHT